MEFTIYYQGIYLLRPSGENHLYGHEALLRDIQSGIEPLAFFTNARALGRIIELDIQAFKRSCRMFIDNDPGGFLFLNLHPETLCSPNFSPPAVLDFLQEIGLSPSRIILEVLEDWRETELSEIQLALDPFVDEGLQFALDDFVVSSEDMKRWTGLRPNVVKFDRSLVHGVADDQSRQRPLLAFESKAGRSNTLLLYEGVETMADADWLRENTRIPLCQGYYFSRPAPIGLAEPAAPQSSLPQILNQTGTRQMEKECA